MTYYFKVGEDGRTMVLPVELAQELGLRPGEEITADVSGRTFRVTMADVSDDPLLALRQVMQGYTLDQFLADRRRDGGA